MKISLHNMQVENYSCIAPINIHLYVRPILQIFGHYSEPSNINESVAYITNYSDIIWTLKHKRISTSLPTSFVQLSEHPK